MTDTNQLIERLNNHGRYWKVGDDKSEQRARDCDKAADVIEAQQKRIEELEAHLGASLAVITDYVEYEHDGDPWTEDARVMGEMDIDEFAKDGRLDTARAALAGKGGS